MPILPSSIECIKCGEDFNPNHPNNKGGFINVCGACGGRRDVNRTIGMIVATGKTDQFTQIIKNPSPEIRQFVKRQGKCGPSQTFTSLGLSTNGANTPKDNMDNVHSKLYEGID